MFYVIRACDCKEVAFILEKYKENWHDFEHYLVVITKSFPIKVKAHCALRAVLCMLHLQKQNPLHIQKVYFLE